MKGGGGGQVLLKRTIFMEKRTAARELPWKLSKRGRVCVAHRKALSKVGCDWQSYKSFQPPKNSQYLDPGSD